MYRKYGNKKVKMGDKIFDSMKEAYRYNELKMLEDHGKIKDLMCQVPFILVPKFTAPSGKQYKSMKYVADFVYYDMDGTRHIEDVKGYKTSEYKLKAKLMAYQGNEIEEIT